MSAHDLDWYDLADTLPARIVCAVLRDLSDRRGFSPILDNLDDEIRHGMAATLANIVGVRLAEDLTIAMPVIDGRDAIVAAVRLAGPGDLGRWQDGTYGCNGCEEVWGGEHAEDCLYVAACRALGLEPASTESA